MPDKEKIIKGLEECAGNGNCTKCQYGKEKQALSCKKLLADVFILLKEQEDKIKQYEKAILKYEDELGILDP